MTEAVEITKLPQPIFGTNQSRTAIAALVLILALAAFLRWHSIADRDFFFDELWIAELSSGHGSAFYSFPLNGLFDQPNTIALSNALPFWKVPARITGAIHPPGTFMMLRLWREVFGDSLIALRSCSATWSTVVVLLTFIAARLSFGTLAGLGAATLSAISEANIDQAQDVRGYTMLQAMMLLTVIALLKMQRRSSCWPGAIAVGLGTLLMMFTHYFAAGACAAISFAAILLLPARVRWQTLFAIAIAGVIWVVTWLPQLRAQLLFVPDTADIFLKDRAVSPPLATLLRLLCSPCRSLVFEAVYDTPLTIISGLVVIYLLMLRLTRRGGDHARRLSFAWLAIVIALLGQLFVLDLARQTQLLDSSKYIMLANPALCVLLGSLRIGPRWLMPALICLMLGVASALTPFPTKPELRPLMAFLTQRASPGDLFIITSDVANPHEPQALYLYLAHALPWPTHEVFLQVGYGSPQLVASLPRGHRWFNFAASPQYRPEVWLPGTRVIDTGSSGGFGLWQIEPVDNATTAPAIGSMSH